MARLQVPTYDTQPISWHQTLGSVDISDLTGGSHGRLASRVWDDSADLGLSLRSHRTGREVLFVLADVERDSDGTIERWLFVNYDREDGSLGLYVYND